MSAATSGNGNGLWIALQRIAGPLIHHMAMATDEPEEEPCLVITIETASYNSCEQDAERWDGLS